MKLRDLNALDRPGFTAALGWIYEGSPWAAEGAWQRRPFGDLDELASALAQTVNRAGREAQLALIRAHPGLGARARMAEASVREQAGAGLDQLTASEDEELQLLNGAYTARFGFPFILAVKGKTKRDILASLQERSRHGAEAEWQRALAEIHQIAFYRLQDTVEDQ